MRNPVVLGLDFGGTKIAIAACDPTGEQIGSTTVQTLAEHGARAGLERGIRAAHALLDEVAPDRDLVAVGAATIGVPGETGIALAPAVPGWSDLALAAELHSEFGGAEIRIATDVKAAAQVEADRGALVDCDPGIYLNLGTGLAVAIVVGGTVLTGRHGASGEIGYNLRTIDDVGRRSADRTILEEAVSGGAFMRSTFGLRPPGGSASSVFAQADHSGPISDRLDMLLDELAFHVVNLAIAVDPARVVVGGGMVRSWNRIEGRLRLALQSAVPFPPDLVPGAFPFDAPLLGAITLATTAARERLTRETPIEVR